MIESNIDWEHEYCAICGTELERHEEMICEMCIADEIAQEEEIMARHREPNEW